MIKRVINDPLVRGSAILIIAFGIFNFLNFAFHVIMARSLSIADYGILATLLSIMYIMGFFTESIQTIITKYAAMQKNDGKLAGLLRKGLRKVGKTSVILFIFYMVISAFLSSFLEIPWPLIAINGLMIFCALHLPIVRGLLQGQQRFAALGLGVVAEAVVKLISGTLLVLIGWRIYGAVLGTILGAAGSYLISRLSLLRVYAAKETETNVADIYQYSKPAFILTTGFLAFYSLDIILAKLLLGSYVAGAYAMASILAKMLFLATQPITRVMFPLAVTPESHGKNGRDLLLKAAGLFAPLIVITLAAFYLFPNLIIYLFSGREMPEVASALWPMGLGVMFMSLANLLISYRLSRNTDKFRGYIVFLAPIIETVVLVMFSQSLYTFVWAFVGSCVALFVISVMLTLPEILRKKTN